MFRVHKFYESMFTSDAASDPYIRADIQLRILLLERGVTTPSQLCGMLDKATGRTVRKWWHMKSPPTIAFLKRLSELLGVCMVFVPIDVIAPIPLNVESLAEQFVNNGYRNADNRDTHVPRL